MATAPFWVYAAVCARLRTAGTMFAIYSILLTLLSAAPVAAQARASHDTAKADLAGYMEVSYCDLIRNPEAYDGKRVAVQATYRYGFEWQELFCLKCRWARTWLEFPAEPDRPIKFHNAPRYQGTINATFYGKFCGRKGAYGDGGYQYQFDVDFARDEKVVSKSGADPSALSPVEQRRVCQGTPAEILADPPIVAFGRSKSRGGCDTMSYENRNQVDYGRLRIRRLVGKAVDPNGVAVPGVCVGLFTDPGQMLIMTTVTGPHGTFELRSAPVGDYRLVAKYPAFGTGNARVRIGRGAESVFLRMRPAGIDTTSYVEAK
jgi:hypothetical protein